MKFVRNMFKLSLFTSPFLSIASKGRKKTTYHPPLQPLTVAGLSTSFTFTLLNVTDFLNEMSVNERKTFKGRERSLSAPGFTGYVHMRVKCTR